MGCEKISSKAVLYFVGVSSMLSGLLVALVLVFYGSSADPAAKISNIVSSTANLSLGMLLLAGLIKKKKKLIEGFVYISTCLLAIGSSVVIILFATHRIPPGSVNFVVGEITLRWLVQFLIFWAYRKLREEDNGDEKLIDGDFPEKPVVKM